MGSRYHRAVVLAAVVGAAAAAQAVPSQTPTAAPAGHDDAGCHSSNDSWWIGVIGTIFGSIVSNFGNNLQKTSLDRDSARPEEMRRASLRQPLWVAGLACMILGAIADFVVLPFAPQSLLAPLATITLVVNVGMANFMNKERPTRRNLFATSMIIAGTACVVVFGDRCEKTYGADALVARFAKAAMLAYVACVAAGLGAGVVAAVALDARAAERKVPVTNRRSAAFVMAAVGGTFGGNTVLCAKAVGELIADSIRRARPGQGVLNWHTALFVPALAANLLLQVRFLNEAIRRYAMLLVIPVYSTCWIASSTLAGLIYFEEYADLARSRRHLALFSAGTLLALVGVFVLANDAADSARKRSASRDGPPSPLRVSESGADFLADSYGSGSINGPVRGGVGAASDGGYRRLREGDADACPAGGGATGAKDRDLV